MTEIKLKKRHISLIFLIVIHLVAALLFGLIGLRTVFGFTVIVFLPVYLFLSLFELAAVEKIIYSVFLGFGIYPMTVWFLNRIIPSLKLSIALTSVLLILVYFLIRRTRSLRN